MTSLAASFTRPRKSFAKIPPAVDIPYLIEVQRNSYGQFLQMEVDPDKRKNTGLQGVFRSVSLFKTFRARRRSSLSTMRSKNPNTRLTNVVNGVCPSPLPSRSLFD